MIKIEGNILIVSVEKDTDKAIFDDIIKLYNSKVNNDNRRQDFLKLSEEYHQINEDFKFKRGELYNDQLPV